MRKRWQMYALLNGERMPVQPWNQFYSLFFAKRHLFSMQEAAHKADISPLNLAYYIERVPRAT